MDFNDILEAVDQLPLDAQEELVEILRKRVRELRREELAREALQARKEFEGGLASLAGGWESSEELLEQLEEILRTRSNPA